jgi:hypothetical protein
MTLSYSKIPLTKVGCRVLAASPMDAQPRPAGWSTDDPGVGRRENGEQSGDLDR